MPHEGEPTQLACAPGQCSKLATTAPPQDHHEMQPAAPLPPQLHQSSSSKADLRLWMVTFVLVASFSDSCPSMDTRRSSEICSSQQACRCVGATADVHEHEEHLRMLTCASVSISPQGKMLAQATDAVAEQPAGPVQWPRWLHAVPYATMQHATSTAHTSTP